MCQIDFDHELGEALYGSTVYSSVEDLKKNHECWESCGIVEVSVSLTKIIHDQNLEFEYND